MVEAPPTPPDALTMFLKWALRVPVVWWYSITQLLLRISPLLSLQVREKLLSTQLFLFLAAAGDDNVCTHLLQASISGRLWRVAAIQTTSK